MEMSIALNNGDYHFCGLNRIDINNTIGEKLMFVFTVILICLYHVIAIWISYACNDTSAQHIIGNMIWPPASLNFKSHTIE